ncbi:c-type cytochrome [Hoeflea alexandrii]|uniref:c-type cytochrome n=1 Tax=Hoeflea alexandrii TaxID=288436 RepID=UPI0022AFF1AB|nr:cytochrome c [Hoeflea alexandrii]MCZ4292364.1 cytochrome c [Hoeflea alexandrii]
MRFKENLPKYFVMGFFGLGLVVLISKNFKTDSETSYALADLSEISNEARVGQALFGSNCASCHGDAGGGTEKGPPLIHDIYNPGHHPDEAFFSAVANGVPQHHWPFGNMPKLGQVTPDEVAKIVGYVREIQLANGITYKPHKM